MLKTNFTYTFRAVRTAVNYMEAITTYTQTCINFNSLFSGTLG